MNVAFRVDASGEMGAGHLFRCMTLAAALAEQGARCRFITRRISDVFSALVIANGFELTRLPSSTSESSDPRDDPYQGWLGAPQAEDAKQTILALQGQCTDWLIVDHYALDSNWETMLRGSATRILVIDDLANRKHDCDILLDQNLYLNAESRYLGKVPEGCRVLLGPRYALLRKEFSRARAQVTARSGPVAKILVFYGAVDATNRTDFAIEALIAADIRDTDVDIIIGADHPNVIAIEAACKRAGFALHIQTNQMAALMAAADLGIGAGGSATWERCSVGLPTLACAVATNQISLVSDCALAGALYAINLEGAKPCELAIHIRALLANPLLRESISRKGMEIVDGEGTRRVLRAMNIIPVIVREATLSDSRNLFRWRNHPAVRDASRSVAPLEWDAHDNWLKSVIYDQSRNLLVGEKAGTPVGVVRFDLMEGIAEVSIYAILEPTQQTECFATLGGKRAPSIGSDLLAAAEQWLIRNRPEVKIVRAEVLGENQASHRLFHAAGYKKQSVTYRKGIGK